MSKCYDNPEYDNISNGLQNTWKQFTPIEPKQELELLEVPMPIYKQETLEEAAELFFRKKDAKNCTLYKAAKLGAKWQQERSYSEKEVIELLNKREDCINKTSSIFDYTTAKEWLEKFKKK